MAYDLFSTQNLPFSNTPIAVSALLDLVNEQLAGQRFRVQGEIGAATVKGHVYFSLRDPNDQSVLECLMWQSNYITCGIEFKEGLEVIIEGALEVYKPRGKLTFKAQTVELVGEGALKKAYDQLKTKLSAEGLFLEERKKLLPEYPKTIGIITSQTGAVIHDFMNNLGRFGFSVKFYNSNVEGQKAVPELLAGLKYFENNLVDALVIIRGGGSFESLQAFNNEVLVRKIASFPYPTILGIGHDKDVPLACLAADKMVSTPTAVAELLNVSWNKVGDKVHLLQNSIFYLFEKALQIKAHRLESLHYVFLQKAEFVFNLFEKLELRFNTNIEKYSQALQRVSDFLHQTEKTLKNVNPERLLHLGYSLVRFKGVLVKSVDDVSSGDKVAISVADGSIESKVI